MEGRPDEWPGEAGARMKAGKWRNRMNSGARGGEEGKNGNKEPWGAV